MLARFILDIIEIALAAIQDPAQFVRSPLARYAVIVILTNLVFEVARRQPARRRAPRAHRRTAKGSTGAAA